MNNDYLRNLSSESHAYADSLQRYETQLPLLFSYPVVSGSRNPDDLYKDDNSYLAYPSGVHQTAVVTSARDRYGSLTITSSGQFSFYIQVAEFAADSDQAFIGTPVVVSGEGGASDLFFATYYENTPQDPWQYAMTIPQTGTYSVVFPNPVSSRAFTVTHSGSAPYSITQLLPRKLVQRYDIEVNSIKAYHVSSTLIDTIALQVSDSIVVGSGLIGEKSIDGSKIIDGTISGVLITNGTVTGNKILAGTISGALITGGTITFDKIASKTLTSSQIADATITGQNIVAGTVSGVLITDDTISASKIQANTITANQIAAGTITGDRIYAGTISGALIAGNTITAEKLSVNQLSAITSVMGTLQVNESVTVSGTGHIQAGKTLVNTSGIMVGDFTQTLGNADAIRIVGSGGAGNIVGIALYNGAFSSDVNSPLAAVRLDGTTALEIDNNRATNDAIINLNFAAGYTGQVNVYNGNLEVTRSDNSLPGAIRGTTVSGVSLYELSTDSFRLTTLAGIDNFLVTSATGDTDIRGNVTVSGSISHRDAGILLRTANQTVNAGTSARVQLNVAGTGNIIGNTTSGEMTVAKSGLYLVNAAVSSATTNLTWNVRANASSFTSGTLVLAGLTFNDGRALNTNVFYLTNDGVNPPDKIALFVNNTGGSAATVTGALRIVRLT